MKIVIYGMGKEGIKFLKQMTELDNKDVDIIGLTDSNKLVKDRLDNKMKELFQEKDIALKLSYDYIVISSIKYYVEIKKQLISEGIQENSILSKVEFEDGFLPKVYCNFCGESTLQWELAGNEYDIFQRRRIIGGGRRRGICPHCFSTDRIRYEWYILKEYTNILKRECKVLHFAPEKELEEQFKRRASIEYLTADIMPGRAALVEDITKLSFADNTFDYIICNHVMEHVIDENSAFSELYRCLRENGIAVITVPICWEIDTYENPSIKSEEERIREYGQQDHVRLYGRDIVERIEHSGFKVECIKSDELFSDEELKKYGYIKGDSVFLCKKIGV